MGHLCWSGYQYTDSRNTHPPYVHFLPRFSKPFSTGNFRKERFEFYQNQKILEQRIRDSAREALSRMLEIERCDPESKASGGSSLIPSGRMTAIYGAGMSGDE